MQEKTIRNIFIISIIGYLIYKLESVLTPFFIALFIAYLINPLIKFIQNNLRVRKRGLSVAIGLTASTLLITSAILASIPVVNEEFQRAIVLVKEYAEFIPPIPIEVNDQINEFIHSDQAKDLINSDSIAETINKVSPLLENLFSESIHLLMGIFGLFFILLYLIFILVSYPKLNKTWMNWIPAKYRNTAEDIATDLNSGMRAYFRGQATIAFIVGILCCVGFKLIGLPLAILLGVLIGCLNLVPYLQILGFIPAFLLSILHSLETGTSIWASIGATLLVLVVVQIIQESVLVPKIMKKVTGLNPAIILLSLSIWGSLLGITGLIIALPVTTLLISYYKRKVSENLVE